MRSLILSLPIRMQPFFIVTLTIALAFLIAFICSLFFDAHQLKINTDLISSVYQVLGTIYAILLTFTLWGVWQNFTEAEASVQNESFALLDLVHTIESSTTLNGIKIRTAALTYSEQVVNHEWPTLQSLTFDVINAREESHAASIAIVKVVQSIIPHDAREVSIFSHTMTMLNTWLDSRRKRILIAKGDSAKALWPLLLAGAFVLFGFHGLFIAQTTGIWLSLLFGLALIIGLTFYLIFTLDCPYTGSLSIDSVPFKLAISILKQNPDYKN